MAITLQQAKVGMADKVVTASVIDSFQRNSDLLNALVFDNAVSPATGGSTMTYGYLTLKTPATATGRAINSEYTAQAAIKEKSTVDLKIMGGSYEIDRVLGETGGSGATDEIAFQSQEKVKATINFFNYSFINGDGSTSNTFKGLKTLLASSDTEIDGSSVDVSGAMTQAKAEALCEALDETESTLMRKPDFIIANSKTLLKIKAAARLLGYYSQTENAFGVKADAYDGVQLLDFKNYYNGSTTAPICGDGDIYFVCLGLDGLHGVSPLTNSAFISTHLPNFSEAGAVKKGDVELVACIALKNTRAAAVLKGVKIASI